MSQNDYEQKKRECWEDFKRENLDGEVQWQPVSRYDVFCAAFDRAYALGKQETKQEIKQETDAEDTVISGWVCRDEDGSLTLFYGSDKPSKKENDDYWSAVFGNTLEYLPQEMFPDVKWEDVEPTKIELIIKRKKNG